MTVHFKENVKMNFKKFISVIADKVESLDLDLNQIDIDKYKGLIDQFTQK